MYYSSTKAFLEAGKRRLAGDTVRAEATDEVKADVVWRNWAGEADVGAKPGRHPNFAP